MMTFMYRSEEAKRAEIRTVCGVSLVVAVVALVAAAFTVNALAVAVPAAMVYGWTRYLLS